MKYAVISDIHANLEALTGVLRQIDRSPVDAIVCLGDIVGYHANPNECIALLEASKALCITGNHDRAALGRKDVLRFSARARRVIHWTKTALTDKSRGFLASLPQSRRVATGVGLDARDAFDAFFCVHGALHPEPNDDIHLTTYRRIESSLAQLAGGRFGARLCFFGHTHHAVVHTGTSSGCRSSGPEPRALDESGAHYLVNPGSVGEPRGPDGRASFLIFDSTAGTIEFHRLTYDVRACMAKVEKAGLLCEPTLASRSADWLFDKLDTGRSVARRLALGGLRRAQGG
jgi:predicted phosphodiesterase